MNNKAAIALGVVVALVIGLVMFIALMFSDEDMFCEPEEGTSTGVPAGSFAMPESVPPATETSGFGMRWGSIHQGVDLAGGAGTPIYAFTDGVVTVAGPASGFGQWIIIDHLIDGERVSTVYGHMFPEDVLVQAGQTVRAGQMIAREGYNGQVSPPGPGGSHLHFQIHPGGYPSPAVDPSSWLEKATNVGSAPGPTSVDTGDTPSKVQDGEELPPLPPSVGSEANYQRDSIRLARAVHQQFPEIQSIGGWRPVDAFPDHPSGRAVDVMIPNWETSEGQALGTRVKDWIFANRAKFNVEYMIWQQTYIPSSGAGNTMEDRGSPTQNHFDHVHITTVGGGHPTGEESYAAPEGMSGAGSVGGYTVNPDCNGSGQAGTSETLMSGTVPEEFEPWLDRGGQVCEGVDAPLLAAQLDAESGFQKDAASGAGAQGYAQFMPGTWATYGRKVDENGNAVGPPGSGDPNNPGDAVMAQANYMCDIQKDLAPQVASGAVEGDLTELALAAYNAGPGAVLEYGKVPPYAETQGYTKKILEARNAYIGD
ncbi:MAG: peptidoglycan DD-metalloendopeptidase family protein [Corynebacterium casei]